MRSPRKSIKNRLSTKEKFLIRQQNKNATGASTRRSVFRQRQMLFPLIVIFAAFVLLFIIKGLYNATDRQKAALEGEQSSETQEMDYEEAKKIFGG